MFFEVTSDNFFTLFSEHVLLDENFLWHLGEYIQIKYKIFNKLYTNDISLRFGTKDEIFFAMYEESNVVLRIWFNRKLQEYEKIQLNELLNELALDLVI